MVVFGQGEQKFKYKIIESMNESEVTVSVIYRSVEIRYLLRIFVIFNGTGKTHGLYLRETMCY